MSDCSHKCGGRCCQGFYLSATPDRVGELYLWSIARIQAFEATDHDWETVFIAEMVIRIDEPDEAKPFYRCAHHDEATGLCTVYDQRPSMCRRFPYGRVCDYGCGYQNGLETPHVAISPKQNSEDADARAA